MNYTMFLNATMFKFISYISHIQFISFDSLPPTTMLNITNTCERIRPGLIFRVIFAFFIFPALPVLAYKVPDVSLTFVALPKLASATKQNV